MQIIMCYIDANQKLHTSLSWGIVLQYTMIGTQFYDMTWLRRSFTTCNGLDTVIRLTLVGIQLYNNILYPMNIKIRVQWTLKIYTCQKHKYNINNNEINIECI